MANEHLKGHLDLLLLEIVAGGPAHGYQVIEQLRARSGGVFDLPEGTVYPALHRLERNGELSSEWDTGGGRRRRVYRITSSGRRQLRSGRADWKRFAGGMSAVIGATA